RVFAGGGFKKLEEAGHKANLLLKVSPGQLAALPGHLLGVALKSILLLEHAYAVRQAAPHDNGLNFLDVVSNAPPLQKLVVCRLPHRFAVDNHAFKVKNQCRDG